MVYKCAGRFRIDPDTDEPICDYEAPKKWSGRCPKCRMPYDAQRYGAERSKTKIEPMSLASAVKPLLRMPTGVPHFDDVIGGGLVGGVVILLGGARGSGKTTLTVMLCDAFATEKRRVMYASAEENEESVILTGQRIGALNPHVDIIGNERATDLDRIFERARDIKPALLVIDALQAVTSGAGIDAGGPAGRGIQAATQIGRFCEKTNICAIVLNHVTRANEFAGSATVEHFVKTIMMFAPFNPADDGSLKSCVPKEELEAGLSVDDVRVLLGVGKNRIGPANEKRFFEMTATGLRPIPRKSKLHSV